MRRAGSPAREPAATSSANDASGQRRNGLPALTCMTTSAIGRRRRRRARAAASTAARRRRIDRHLDRSARRVRRRDVERREQIPLVLDRMARPQLARPRDAPRVHPAPAGDLVADAHRRAAQPRQQRRARPAVEIDGEIERARAAAGGRAPRSREQPAHARAARRDDHLVEMRIAGDDRRGRRFDEVGEVGVGKPPAQGADGRRGEDDVADLRAAEPAGSDELRRLRSAITQSRNSVILDRRFVDQHHRDVVLDGIDALARGALERGAVLDERDRRLAVRTGENFEQFRVDGHAGNI